MAREHVIDATATQRGLARTPSGRCSPTRRAGRAGAASTRRSGPRTARPTPRASAPTACSVTAKRAQRGGDRALRARARAARLPRDRRHAPDPRLPLRGHADAVRRGTEISWRSVFRAKYPGLGGLVRRRLGAFIQETRRSPRARRPRARRPQARDAAHDPLHGQGRRRQDVGRRGDRAAAGRRRAPHADRLDRPGALARRRARRRAGARAAPGRRPPLRPAGRRPGRDGAPLGGRPGLARRAARAPRHRPHLGRGADRPAGPRRALQPARDPPPPRRGRLRGDRRRLRADGRDAAAALVPGRRALVAGEGVSPAQPHGRGGAAVRPRAAGRARARRGRSGCCAT